MSRRLAQRYEERILPWMETAGTVTSTLSQHIPIQDSRRSTVHPCYPSSGIDVAVGHAVQQASIVYPKIHGRHTSARHGNRSRPSDALRSLPQQAGHSRNQVEVLRHLLRPQGLPRRVGRPGDSSLARKRVGSSSGAVRSLRGRTEHHPVFELSRQVPPLFVAVQSRLPSPLSFLLRERRNCYLSCIAAPEAKRGKPLLVCDGALSSPKQTSQTSSLPNSCSSAGRSALGRRRKHGRDVHRTLYT
jgi:hypothetical protein